MYEAISKKTKEKFAVKIIEKSMLQDDIKLLRREIQIMKKVDHPNILKLHEIYEDDDKVYIVMELCVQNRFFLFFLAFSLSHFLLSSFLISSSYLLPRYPELMVANCLIA